MSPLAMAGSQAVSVVMTAWSWRSRLPATATRAWVLVSLLGQRRKQLAGTLSGGEQQMVANARALMSRPRLLILDEPSLGLAPMLVDQVLRIARSVVDDGCSVLIAEQNVEATLQVCDRAYVLEAGRVTASGTPSELARHPKLLAAFIGLEEDLDFDLPTSPTTAPA